MAEADGRGEGSFRSDVMRCDGRGCFALPLLYSAPCFTAYLVKYFCTHTTAGFLVSILVFFRMSSWFVSTLSGRGRGSRWLRDTAIIIAACFHSFFGSRGDLMDGHEEFAGVESSQDGIVSFTVMATKYCRQSNPIKFSFTTTTMYKKPKKNQKTKGCTSDYSPAQSVVKSGVEVDAVLLRYQYCYPTRYNMNCYAPHLESAPEG